MTLVFIVETKNALISSIIRVSILVTTLVMGQHPSKLNPKKDATITKCPIDDRESFYIGQK